MIGADRIAACRNWDSGVSESGQISERGDWASSPAEIKKHGGMGIRTPGLVIANDALYQLSYTPEILGTLSTAKG